MAWTMPLWLREKGAKVPGKKAAFSGISNWKGPLWILWRTIKR